MFITDDRRLGMCCSSLLLSFLPLCGWFVDSRYALKGPYDLFIVVVLRTGFFP